MRSRAMPHPPPQSRTNALAFAKTDCHTCIANKRQCDRKRPRCSSCSGRDIVCGGYPIPLTWPKKSQQNQHSVSTSPKQVDDTFFLEPLSLQASMHMRDKHGRPQPRRLQRFRFVNSAQAERQKRTLTSKPGVKVSSVCPHEAREWTSTPQDTGTLNSAHHQCTRGSPLLRTDECTYDSITVPSHLRELKETPRPFVTSYQTDSPLSLLDWCIWSSTTVKDIGILGVVESSDCNFTRAVLSSGAWNVVGEQCSSASAFRDFRENSMNLESPVLFDDLFGKFESLLIMYDQNFCIVPLTGDVSSNPFRFRLEASRGSQALLHAVLAVSCHHAGRLERRDNYLHFDVLSHHNTAVKLYRDEFESCAGLQGAPLLDTVMVLFLFNATQSAFSDWAIRISEVRQLLRLSGGAGMWVHDRRVQAQVVMLLWWDATIALLSRQGCILPYYYFESLLALEDDHYWTFFDLVGCPRELIVPLMQLANLAAENEKASSMCETIDLALVDEIQTSLINCKNPTLEIHDDILEEHMQQNRDRWHCIEAWRYGLLVYITRVFRWDRKADPPSRLATYARLVLEHVQACRRTAMVQKQMLLPLFFAGCEIRDSFWRQSIREYCQYWGEICGYDLFRTASSLLEDVWVEQDAPCSNGTWWGSVIGRKQAYQTHIAAKQFCFG
ncbi:fungal-specific transcription factor domain-containing protein [Xylogone sp. PMI_703]|nr:fungal-specific transcription factor domain-containing protein [Xylogone sp. PMI_703]